MNNRSETTTYICDCRCTYDSAGTYAPCSNVELQVHAAVFSIAGRFLMHAAVERILSTYAMMRNLSEKDIEGLRADVITFLSKHEDLDEGRMAVEGIRYLRQRTRRG
jgi:hypothetical protein